MCFVFEAETKTKKKRTTQSKVTEDEKAIFQCALPLREGAVAAPSHVETVEMWPDADKVDFLRHLDDLTEDHRLSPLIGIRYSRANEALNLLISLHPSPDRSGLFCFLSSRRTTADAPHACLLLHK